MRLLAIHPHLANVDCRKCAKFACDLKTGVFFEQGGLLIPRGPTGPPCRTDSKACPKVAPGLSDLTDQNKQVVRHFRECKATGQWPDDPIVREHAAILTRILEDAAERHRARQSRTEFEQMAMIMLRNRRR